MELIRGKLTYANVMATIAVFIALGGGAYAVKLKRNSVGPRQLKQNAVTERKLADGAVTNPKIASSAVTGGKIAAGAVDGPRIAAGAVDGPRIAEGAVDGSKVADGSIGLSDSDPSLHQLCPSGTTYLVGACIDDTATPQNKWPAALADCVSRGGALPTLTQVALLKARLGAGFEGGWTDQTFQIDLDDDNVSAPFFKSIYMFPNGTVTAISNAGDGAYRCVFDVVG